MKQPKKQKTERCPVCNSARFELGPNEKVCLNCGYKHKNNADLEISGNWKQ